MLTLKEIKPGDPDYYKPIDELMEDLGNAKSGRTYGDVIITVEDLTDAIYYLQTYKDMIDKLESCQKENRRLKKRVEKLESDAAWDADNRRGQVQGMW